MPCCFQTAHITQYVGSSALFLFLYVHPSYLLPSVHAHKKHLSLYQTTMTSSKSDLEAKEGQIPNESNFLEFVSLLGSLSTRAGGASTQEDERPERKEEVGAAEEGESQQKGLFLYLLYLHVL